MSYFLSQARFGCFTISLDLRLTIYPLSNVDHRELVIFVPNLKTISLQVVALDVDLPVKQAFHILHEQVSTLFSPKFRIELKSILHILKDFLLRDMYWIITNITLIATNPKRGKEG